MKCTDMLSEHAKYKSERTLKIIKRIRSLKQRLKNRDLSSLSSWDQESLRIVSQIEVDKREDEFHREIAKIMRLAGLSYAVERENFARKERIRNEWHEEKERKKDLEGKEGKEGKGNE